MKVISLHQLDLRFSHLPPTFNMSCILKNGQPVGTLLKTATVECEDSVVVMPSIDRERSDSYLTRDPNILLKLIAKNQDKYAFENLYGQFAPKIKALMLKFGSDEGTAEELAQETMILVWRKSYTFDRAKASASTWIFTIARNLRIDRFRSENRPEWDPKDPALVPEPEVPADEQIDLKNRQKTVRQCLNNLPNVQREVTELSFVGGLTHQEIAKKLGIPLGTVKSRLRLSFEKLRQMMRNSYD